MRDLHDRPDLLRREFGNGTFIGDPATTMADDDPSPGTDDGAVLDEIAAAAVGIATLPTRTLFGTAVPIADFAAIMRPGTTDDVRRFAMPGLKTKDDLAVSLATTADGRQFVIIEAAGEPMA